MVGVCDDVCSLWVGDQFWYWTDENQEMDLWLNRSNNTAENTRWPRNQKQSQQNTVSIRKNMFYRIYLNELQPSQRIVLLLQGEISQQSHEASAPPKTQNITVMLVSHQFLRENFLTSDQPMKWWEKSPRHRS